MNKTCTKCGKTKPLEDFPKHINGKYGKDSKCKECNVKNWQKYYEKNTDHAKDKRKKWNQENYQKNKEQVLEAKRKSREKTKKARAAYMKQYKKDNPHLQRQYNQTRRASLKQRMPAWLTDKDKQRIKDFYANCPDGMEVDHIYPLNGKEVSGFHHPDNLQYLLKKENRKKSNKLPS